ncbi:MAG TPA: Zn-ribbon domain-containing OB-fold protein [Anaerolineales bacterium]|nr:Zn-ribbon domain-containing OB-fold protein [Anaerolineales bacterium]
MSLLERDPNAPQAWYGDLPVSSRYTFGLAGERFFRTIKEEGRIMGSHCKKCNHTHVPAAQFCEMCLNELSDWVDVGTVGELHTFTVLYEAYDGARLEQPEIVAFVGFGDGGLVHRLQEIDPEDIYFGMPVEAVFKPKDQRVGSILDIAYFRPVS